MRIATAALGLAALAACAGEDLTPRQEANRWALANAEPVGEAVECVEIAAIRNSIGRDERTIDFWTIEGRIFRNRLAGACPGIASVDRFLYRTERDRLCAGDEVTALRADNTRGPTCRLGAFREVRVVGD